MQVREAETSQQGIFFTKYNRVERQKVAICFCSDQALPVSTLPNTFNRFFFANSYVGRLHADATFNGEFDTVSSRHPSFFRLPTRQMERNLSWEYSCSAGFSRSIDIA